MYIVSVQSIKIQQFLFISVADNAVFMCFAGRLCYCLAETVLALWPVLQILKNLRILYKYHQRCTASVSISKIYI